MLYPIRKTVNVIKWKPFFFFFLHLVKEKQIYLSDGSDEHIKFIILIKPTMKLHVV